jgi:hypothetical protein
MGGGKGGRLQGIEVKRRAKNGPHDRRAAQVRIRRICLRYEGGRRVCFVPEAGEEFFSRDDAHRVVGMLHTGSEDIEGGWRYRRGSPEKARTTPEPYDARPAAGRRRSRR